MQIIQLAVIILVVLVLAWLLIDGAMTRAVWVKGARDGLFSFRHWAHKRYLDEDPRLYWFAMGFYAFALVGLCILMITS